MAAKSSRRRTQARRGGRVGRPPLAPEKVRSQRVVVMLTEPQLRKLERLAQRDRIPPSTLAFRFVEEALSRRR